MERLFTLFAVIVSWLFVENSYGNQGEFRFIAEVIFRKLTFSCFSADVADCSDKGIFNEQCSVVVNAWIFYCAASRGFFVEIRAVNEVARILLFLFKIRLRVIFVIGNFNSCKSTA